MGKRMDTLRFPDGKTKALTFSYDDGVVQDRRLVSLLNRYGLKGTFNLGYGVLGFQGNAEMNGRTVDISKVLPEEVPMVYAGHEVAGHGLLHSALNRIGTPAAMWEIIEDKRCLERRLGKLVRSFAYPFGAYDDSVKLLLRLAGYKNARTVISSGKFDLPSDLLAWEPTCHHSDSNLMELAEAFCANENPFSDGQLFYLWGHAYEFDADDNWSVIEEFTAYMGKHSDTIWFATNGEIADYLTAFRSLEYSADAGMIYNPTGTELWIGVQERIYTVPPKTTVFIEDPGL